MSRFTKSAAIAEIQASADAIQAKEKFDRNNGTSQLLPKGADTRMQIIINRAVAYGRMRACEQIANDIESGHLGVTGKY
jgi:hypothetical protein